MKGGYVLPALAIVGGILAFAVIHRENRPTAVEVPPVSPSFAPFLSYVAGSGVVEASTGNIAIGTPVPGIVTETYVNVDQAVKAGQPLFKIDDRDLQAQLITANAKVKEAAVSLQKPRHQLAYAEQVRSRDPAAVSVATITGLRDDLNTAQSALEAAKAQVQQLQAEIQRHSVAAPVDGSILQIKARLGEYVGPTTPILVLGNEARPNIRVDIDQEDAWRVNPSAAAVAFPRGNPNLRIPLEFAYIEPLVVPKTALTGQSTERTDTRVLQVLYSFERGQLPVYVGEQMDVYISAPPATNSGAEKPH